MEWRLKSRRVRHVEVGTLRWVDGIGYASRWAKMQQVDEDEDDENDVKSDASDGPFVYEEHASTLYSTPLTRRPSLRVSRMSRTSMGGTEVEPFPED
jgi:hypothetical protein